MVDGYNIGARNQLADSGAYKFHIHRAYVIYATIDYIRPMDAKLRHAPVDL